LCCLVALSCSSDGAATDPVDEGNLDSSEVVDVGEETVIGGDAVHLDPTPDTSDDPSLDRPTREADRVADPELTTDATLLNEVYVVENPANVLSFFVDWTTRRPATTRLDVDCVDLFERTYSDDDYRTGHRVFVMGLVENASCAISVLSRDSLGFEESFETGFDQLSPLPDLLPEPTVEQLNADAVQPGWTLFNLSNELSRLPLSIVMVDSRGRYRWYHLPATERWGTDVDVRTVSEGVLIGGNRLTPAIVSWSGTVVWEAAFGVHHDLRPDGDEQHFLYLGADDDCDPPISFGNVHEWSREAAETTWTWRMCDHVSVEPVRDWAHLNSVEPFPGERALLVSSRNQHALYKIDRETGEIVWTLGAGGDFELAEEDRFFHQHAPELQSNGNILLFANGDRNARRYSQAIELAYDDVEMTAEVVWRYRHSPEQFTEIWGDADRLDNGNTLINFGFRSNSHGSRLVEVTAENEVAWELAFPPRWGVYRVERVVETPYGSVLP
jgi:hypothetical protein